MAGSGTVIVRVRQPERLRRRNMKGLVAELRQVYRIEALAGTALDVDELVMDVQRVGRRKDAGVAVHTPRPVGKFRGEALA